MTTICYKAKDGNIYLALYLYGRTLEEGQRIADELNQNRPEFDICGNRINWDVVDYFVAEICEPMF